MSSTGTGKTQALRLCCECWYAHTDPVTASWDAVHLLRVLFRTLPVHRIQYIRYISDGRMYTAGLNITRTAGPLSALRAPGIPTKAPTECSRHICSTVTTDSRGKERTQQMSSTFLFCASVCLPTLNIDRQLTTCPISSLSSFSMEATAVQLHQLQATACPRPILCGIHVSRNSLIFSCGSRTRLFSRAIFLRLHHISTGI